MIISIRGTSGSGKSTIVRKLMASGVTQPLYGVLGPRRPEAYRTVVKSVAKPIHVLGPYREGMCGGCDALQPSVVRELTLKYNAFGHVVLEGLIIGNAYGALCEMLEQFGKEVVVVFLSTPLDVCISRVEGRGAKSGRAKGTTRAAQHYKSILSVQRRVVREGIFRMAEVDSETGHEKVIKWLADESTASR